MTPDEFTIRESFLDVGDGHQLYVHEWGNENAETPIIFMHGGPGGQCKDKHKVVFDPNKHKVIFFDQRGSGRSLPYGSLENNTTKELILDVNKVADHTGIENFVITGGSWGCALSLFYAVAHPKRVKALVLDGVLTGTKKEIEWLDKGRFHAFLPDVWESYVQSVPANHRSNPSKYHFERVLSDDEAAVRESGYAYENMEGAVLSLDDRFNPNDIVDFDPTSIRMEIYYLVNSFFVPDRHVINNTAKLTMPIWLVQGRYDMVCPPITAYELNKKLPNSNLIWTISGHKGERESWNVIRTILAQWS